MDELDLVLYQDTREFRCDRVVFENESSEDGSKSMDSARKSMKIKDFCSSLRYSLDVFGTSEILCSVLFSFFRVAKIHPSEIPGRVRVSSTFMIARNREKTRFCHFRLENQFFRPPTPPKPYPKQCRHCFG